MFTRVHRWLLVLCTWVPFVWKEEVGVVQRKKKSGDLEILGKVACLLEKLYDFMYECNMLDVGGERKDLYIKLMEDKRKKEKKSEAIH